VSGARPPGQGALCPPTVDLADDYVELLKAALIGVTLGRVSYLVPVEDHPNRIKSAAARYLARRGGSVLAKRLEVDLDQASDGSIFASFLPPGVMSMIGRPRMNNLEACVRDVVRNGVPGDLIETGVWRGGSTIFMRGLLKALGVTDRRVYVADSFQGLPAPDVERYPHDRDLTLHLHSSLAVGVEQVKDHFRRFGLLDEQVVFVEGWFSDTLPALAGHRWSVIRLDGDMYESTHQALTALYDGLSLGGWVIVDDFEIPACRAAVEDFRGSRGITDPIRPIDWTGVFWQKSG
jgi:hypothetical protein